MARGKVPTLDGFIEWLEKKDPTATYTWCNSISGRRGCAVEQYFTSLTRSEDKRQAWWGSDPGELDRLAIYDPNTFGALLGRARAARNGR